MQKPPLDFYFDFISPYAHVGWSLVRGIAGAHGRSVAPVPVLFAAILDAHGQKGPAEIPAKRLYTFKDVYRKSIASGTGPIVPPPAHPFNPLLALRAAGLDMPDDARARLVTAIFDATWREGSGCEGAAGLLRIADEAGLDGKTLIEQANQREAKERLKDATARAIDRGVFGVPTVDADGELFWGVDGMGFLSAFLEGNDPVKSAGLERWQNLAASATRRPK